MTATIPEGQPMAVAVRAYVCKADSQAANRKPSKNSSGRKSPKPSEWVLIFDTETTTDAAQRLRFGSYQVRKNGDLMELGLFYDPETLNKAEKETLKIYADKHGLRLLTAQEFIDDVFFKVGYAYRATIVGFNLPFDISRLATDHATARASRFNKIMRGGFTFKLSENPNNPRVQVKHISSRDSFIQFAAVKGQRTSKGNRKKGHYNPARRGFFIDLKTLAAALTSQSYTLASLAQFLEVVAQKYDTESHGQSLSPDYIAYAVQDTQTTWECFEKLNWLYIEHDLESTDAHSIHSEASLGKAYLKEMGIQSWRKTQPDFPPEMLGTILSTYYGGRSEVYIRREITQILYCDFLSMYPTACTLMGLWQFVIAQGMTWVDSTAETQEFLEKVTLSDLQRPETWRSLCTLVQTMPDADIFPVRAKYNDDAQYTIGSNYLTSQEPLWFTLADCISSKLLTGRHPKILKAISFRPEEIQPGLGPVDIAGNSEYRVDPAQGDFFKQVIDLRSSVKRQMKAASSSEKPALENRQLALKILANATSYGIFVELNVEEEKQLQPLLCYGPGGKAMPVNKKKVEATGSFFHPLLATLITGAARLMLAITERLAVEAGLDWAFCDTDSMALAKPETMNQDEFYARARQAQEWFTPLNPYADKVPLLKIEDYNYSPNSKTLLPLYCYAVSSKRYALLNIDAEGKPVLRKVSAHGLGHLIAPYKTKDASYLDDVEPWQQDLWLEIIQAALDNRQPDFSRLENFNNPAVSRYGATTPALLKWFDGYNKNKPYKNQVRPFNFLLAMQSKPELKSLKPVSSYDKNPSRAVNRCFDRATGETIRKSQLKTNLESLAQYHLHPETKFLNGDYLDNGKTQRRHVIAKAFQHIGKEANKWEEQFFTGFDPEAQIEYGVCQEQKDEILKIISQAITVYGATRMANAANLSERHVLKIYHGQANPSEKAFYKLYSAAKILENNQKTEIDMLDEIREIMKEKNISIRALAEEQKIDFSNLAKILSGKRENCGQIERVQAYLAQLD